MKKDQLEGRPGKDFIGVGAFALIFNRMGELLLSRSVKSEKRGGEYEQLWAMIGGTIEFGEAIEAGLRREIEEESGLKLKEVFFLGYNDYIKGEKHWVALNFCALTDSSNFINVEPEKQADLQWFKTDEIPEDISEYTRESLRLLKERPEIIKEIKISI
jgi:8-oxo-dGTP diphosphatase